MTAVGTVTLIGSGETAPIGGQVFESLANQHGASLQIAILETPAGFETNTRRVAGRVASFLQTRLQNRNPRVVLVAARRKGSPFSPDSPEVVAPLYSSQVIFLGPGSPTYTVRQLAGSLAWHILQARQRLGASLVLASAATIAMGRLALPVYEIFKVGDDPHWKPGLDFFQPYGLNLVMIPHWNNREGGDEVDTSRCFIGQERFQQLLEALPPETTLVGIDEHSALTIAPEGRFCHCSGQGNIHLLRAGQQQDYPSGAQFSIEELGPYHPLPSPELGLTAAVWAKAQAAGPALAHAEDAPTMIPSQAQRLVEERQAARQARNWPHADLLRQQLAQLGWEVQDTPSGPVLLPIK